MLNGSEQVCASSWVHREVCVCVHQRTSVCVCVHQRTISDIIFKELFTLVFSKVSCWDLGLTKYIL